MTIFALTDLLIVSQSASKFLKIGVVPNCLYIVYLSSGSFRSKIVVSKVIQGPGHGAQ